MQLGTDHSIIDGGVAEKNFEHSLEGRRKKNAVKVRRLISMWLGMYSPYRIVLKSETTYKMLLSYSMKHNIYEINVQINV